MAQEVEEAPSRLRRVESVLSKRTQRIRLVLEQCIDSHNHQAVLRTAEALGIQHVWVVDPSAGSFKVPTHVKGGREKEAWAAAKKITKGCESWMSMRHFETIGECIAALRAEECEVWATDLSAEAQVLSWENRPEPDAFPTRLAVVIGRESDGVSEEMLAAADKRIYLPMFGFTESFNLSVATALVISRLMDWCPDARGDLTTEQRGVLREEWYGKLAKSEATLQKYQKWLAPEKLAKLTPLEDMRRPSGAANAWVPPKIRKREAALGARAAPASVPAPGLPSTGSMASTEPRASKKQKQEAEAN